MNSVVSNMSENRKSRGTPCKSGFFFAAKDDASSSLICPLGKNAWRPASPVFLSFPPTEPVPEAMASKMFVDDPVCLPATSSLLRSWSLSLSLSLSWPRSESVLVMETLSSCVEVGPP